MKQFKPKKGEGTGLFKGVFMAYVILVLHVLLVASLGCLVLFFSGFIHYMLWIFLGCSAVILFAGYRTFKRMREEGSSLYRMMNAPAFQGKDLEVSLLGGFATFRVGNSGMDGSHLLEAGGAASPPQLEDPATARIRRLGELAQLLEKGLITPEEYNTAKQDLLHS